jgi:hypothetical protein
MTTGIMAAALAARVMLSLATFPACDLVTMGEAASVLGGTPSAPFSMPESYDEESGARMSGCVFELGDMGIAVSIAEFDSRAAVERAMAILAAEDDDEAIRLSPEGGVGERSLWGSSVDGAIWVALQGRRILTVTLFGEIRDPASYKERMKSLAASVLSRQ